MRRRRTKSRQLNSLRAPRCKTPGPGNCGVPCWPRGDEPSSYGRPLEANNLRPTRPFSKQLEPCRLRAPKKSGGFAAFPSRPSPFVILAVHESPELSPRAPGATCGWGCGSGTRRRTSPPAAARAPPPVSAWGTGTSASSSRSTCLRCSTRPARRSRNTPRECSWAPPKPTKYNMRAHAGTLMAGLTLRPPSPRQSASWCGC